MSNIAHLFGTQTVSDILSVAVTYRKLPTNTAYLVGFWGHRKLIGICGKFAAVSHRIWQTGSRNVEKFAAENCRPYVPMYDNEL